MCNESLFIMYQYIKRLILMLLYLLLVHVCFLSMDFLSHLPWAKIFSCKFCKKINKKPKKKIWIYGSMDLSHKIFFKTFVLAVIYFF